MYHTQPPASIHDKSAPTAIVTATSSIRRSIIPKDLLERTRGKVHVAENLVEPEVHGRPDALQGSLRVQVQGAAAERFPTDRRASHAGHLRRVSCCGCRIALESLLERRVAGHLRGWRGWRGAVLCQASGVAHQGGRRGAERPVAGPRREPDRVSSSASRTKRSRRWHRWLSSRQRKMLMHETQVESACWENQINAMDRGWPRWDAQWRVLCMACGRTMLQASARDWGE